MNNSTLFNSPISRQTGDITISTDRTLLQLEVIYSFLKEESYWGLDRDFEKVQISIENSYPIGIYKNGQQIGFARIVTDFSIFGYMADVFILNQYQGKGYGKQMMQFIMELPFVSDLRWFCLATRDAHGLYSQYGFELINRPDLFMEIRNVSEETKAIVKARFNFED